MNNVSPVDDHEDSVTDAEMLRREQEVIAALPKFSVGGFFLPPIWGPAHGMWLTILFYPLWMFADNCLYAAYSTGTTTSIVIAVIVAALMLFVTGFTAFVGQHRAVHRAVSEKGKSTEKIVREERIWGVVSVLVVIAMLAFATWYNLFIRVPWGA